MLVSIIINNYNYQEYLPDAINSALEQSYSDVEVIVVDDGSTDDSRKIISSYDDRVIPIFKENGGQISAINSGFLKSSGEIICLLDADDIFEPSKAEKIAHVFRENPEIGWCFHQQSYVSRDASQILKHTLETKTRKCDFRKTVILGSTLNFVAPSTSGLCFSRQLFQDISPIPESDDVIISDLYIKIVVLGLEEGFFLDEPLVKLRVHHNNRYTEKNNIDLKIKIYRATAFALSDHWPRFRAYANKIFCESINMEFKRSIDKQSIRRSIHEYCDSLPVLEVLSIWLRYYASSVKFLLLGMASK